MARTRKHSYCNGTGTVRLASGSDTVCQPCSGTGRLVVRSAAEKAEDEFVQDVFHGVSDRARRIAKTEISVMVREDFVSHVQLGWGVLRQEQPGRFSKLLVSVDEGRLDDVTRALAQYYRDYLAAKGLSV